MSELLKPRGVPRIDALAATQLARRLRLTRPLVFIDLESTGLDPAIDRIVELAAIRLAPDGEVAVLQTLVNPGITVPEPARRVHGLGEDDLAGAPAFAAIAGSVAEFVADADLAGYNVLRFDLALLTAEMRRAGLDLDSATARVVDPCVIFKLRERRDLQAAYRFYCGERIQRPHTAAADALASMEVLAGQLRHYPDLPAEVGELDALMRGAQPSKPEDA